MKGKRIITLLPFIALVIAIWAVLAFLTNTLDNSWYLDLDKPFWLPPAWALEAIWLILYSLIALSGWIVWTSLPESSFSDKLFHKVMIPYWCQLIIDLAWSILFFGMHQPMLATFDIMLLLLMIFTNIISFGSINKYAARMLVPYFIWVAYATTLSIGFATLN